MERSKLDRLDKISVRNLKVDCIVGLHPHEFKRCQPLLIHIDFYLDTRVAARTTRIKYTADYSRIAAEVDFILQYSKFKLIESAVEAISQHILSGQFLEKPTTAIEAVRVTMEKPEALDGYAIPSIEILRWKKEYSSLVYCVGDGEFIMHKNRDSLLAKKVIPAQSEVWLSHKSPDLEINDMLLSPNLVLHDHEYPLHTHLLRRGGSGGSKVYNKGTHDAYILTVVRGPVDSYLDGTDSDSISCRQAKVYPITLGLNDSDLPRH